MAKQLLRVFVNQFPHNEFLFQGSYADYRMLPYTKKDPKTGYLKSARYDPETGFTLDKAKTRNVWHEGFKSVPQATNVRGLVLLYTSRTPDWSAIEYDHPDEQIKPEDYPSGAIVGAAEVFLGDAYTGEIYMRNIRRFPQPIPFKPRRGAIRWTRVPFKTVEKQLRKVRLLRLAKKSALTT